MNYMGCLYKTTWHSLCPRSIWSITITHCSLRPSVCTIYVLDLLRRGKATLDQICLVHLRAEGLHQQYCPVRLTESLCVNLISACPPWFLVLKSSCSLYLQGSNTKIYCVSFLKQYLYPIYDNRVSEFLSGTVQMLFLKPLAHFPSLSRFSASPSHMTPHLLFVCRLRRVHLTLSLILVSCESLYSDFEDLTYYLFTFC